MNFDPRKDADLMQVLAAARLGHPPHVEAVAAIVEVLAGLPPGTVDGWTILYHNHEHVLGFMWSGHSYETPATRAEVRAMLVETVHELDDQGAREAGS